MALKRVVVLNEGPMDYLRGAAKQVGAYAKQVHQAGQAQSQLGDLDNAVKKLAALMRAVLPAAPTKQQKPAPAQYNTPGAVQANNTTPTASTQPRMTFASYLHDDIGEQLNEGPMDLLKGAAKSVGNFAMNQLKQRSGGRAIDANGMMDKLVDKSQQYAANGQQQQIQAQIQLIRKIVSQSADKPAAAKRVAARLRQFLGAASAPRVYAMVFPQQAAPQAAPTQQQPAQQSSASWKQSNQPAQVAPQPQPQPQPRTRKPSGKQIRPVA